ncbi:MAG: S8 family serine peptidase [Chloroflexi bacterium]|nr:S8 family serine peptidase [Chloroflexota bacterium]
MTDFGPRVEILDGYVASSHPPLYDPVSHAYFDLVPESEPDPTVVVLPNPDSRGRGQRIAIIDTGLMAGHPLVGQRVVRYVDFTSEGPYDNHGHGTAVALVLIKTAPEADLISVKCIDSSGEGSPQALIQALDWVRSEEPESTLVNISAGINRKRWLLFPCDGTCDVCQATQRLCERGNEVIVAAGNLPEETLCPAKLGSKWLISIGGWDARRRYGKGTINLDIPRYRAVPIVPRVEPAHP